MNDFNKDNLRIAMFSEHADPLAPLGGQQSGGQNVFVYELARSLSKLGVKVDVYTRWDNRKASQTVRFAERAKVIRLKAGPRHFIPKEKFGQYMPEFVEHFLEHARKKKIKYDLVHSHYYFSGWAGMQVKNILKIPQVHTYHSLGLVKKRAIGAEDNSFADRLKTEKKILDVADMIIATSPQEKLNLISVSENAEDKIAVIPAGVNLLRFSATPKSVARKKLGLPKDKKIIVFAGRMERNKGADILIKAISLIKKKDPEAFSKLLVLMFSGDPRKILNKEKAEKNLRHSLRALIKKNGLAGNVKLSSGIDQEKLHTYFAAASLVVVPSFYESFGMVAIEAMASGTPVVASNVGGLRWTIEDGITGFHAQPGKPQSFAKQILAILTNEDLEKRLAINATIHAQNNYAWSKVAKKVRDSYVSAIRDQL